MRMSNYAILATLKVSGAGTPKVQNVQAEQQTSELPYNSLIVDVPPTKRRRASNFSARSG